MLRAAVASTLKRDDLYQALKKGMCMKLRIQQSPDRTAFDLAGQRHRRSKTHCPFKIACVCMLMVSFAAAGDPWNQKKSSEWTPADALVVISHSPWAITAKLKCGNPLMPCEGVHLPPEPAQQPHVGDARPVPLSPPPVPGDIQPVFVPGLSKCVGTSGFCESQADESKQKLQQRFPPAQGKIEIPAPLEGTVIVLWESALPVQVAKAKLGVSDTSNRLAAGSYVVSVIGYPMHSAIGQSLNLSQPLPAGIKQLIQQSAVMIPKGKQAIIASDIEIEGSENAMNVRFFFPTDQAIQSTDKKVLFRMQVLLGDIVEAEFTLKSMVYESKPAISDYGSIGR